MTYKEFILQTVAALKAVHDAAAKYLQKNPNATYKDADGIDRPIAFALDIARTHEKSLIDVAEGSDDTSDV